MGRAIIESRPLSQTPRTSPDDPRPDAPADALDHAHDNWKTIARRLGPAGVLAVLWGTLPVIGSLSVFYYIEPIAGWLRTHQSEGPLIYVAALTGLCGFGLLPTYASCSLGGWAFGFVTGIISAMIAFTFASLIGYGIARTVSGERVTQIIREHPRWQVIYEALLGSGTGKTLFIIFLVRLAPNSPFALGNFTFAATKVKWWVYLLGTFSGILPRSAAVVYAASRLETLEPGMRENKWIWFAGIAVTIAVLLIIGTIAKHALARATGRGVEPNRNTAD